VVDGLGATASGLVAASGEEAGTDDFRRRFFARLLEACYQSHAREGGAYHLARDWYDFAVGPRWRDRPRARLRNIVIDALGQAGFRRRQFDLAAASGKLDRIAADLDGFARTYRLLSDGESRELLVDLLAHRVLGRRHVSLPTSVARFWSEVARVDRTMRSQSSVAIEGPGGIPLHRYEVPGRDGRTELHAHPAQVLEIFVLEQYAYRASVAPVGAEPGDVVIDGGACLGETALYFADAVGAQGRVLGFEFVDQSFEILGRNMALNERLADRISLVRRALWDASGEALPYVPAGGVTSVGGDGGDPGPRVEAEALDDFAARASLDRIDLIKLDVEGAELRALKGGERVLREFRPKLAVSVYHRHDDLITIPAYLNTLDLDYEFFLGHRSPGRRETILFCRPR